MTAMEPIVPLGAMERIAAGIDHAEGICLSPDGTIHGHDPEGTLLAAPTNVVFAGPGLGDLLVPNIGRWHVTRFRVPGLAGVPLFYPTRDQIGG